jgi:uncharacterized protein YggU (UPF0235/DUF167 family)
VGSRNYHLHDGKKGAALAVRVIPRSSKNEIAEILNDSTVKIRLTQAADDKKLNQTLLNFLSEVIGVPAGRMEVVAGLSGLDKLVTILDLDAATVQQHIINKMS